MQRGATMQAFSEQISECYRLVDHCACRAEQARDPDEKADFLNMRSRWLLLAQSYEFLERLSRMVAPSPT